MKRLLLLLATAGLLACVESARAQSTITLDTKAGQAVPALGLRRDGTTVMARVKLADGHEGEVGYDVATIARIEFPDPPQLRAATDLLNKGQTDEALKQLTPAVNYYAPFRDIPGNWWAPLAILQVDALSRLGRDAEADALVNDLTRVGQASPDMLRSVKIRQVSALERKATAPSDHKRVIEMLEPIVTDSAAMPQAVAEGWVSLGAAHLALHEYKLSLLAYLHIPLYTPDRGTLMSQALLGSAAAFLGVDDRERAKQMLQTLITKYPGAPEVAEARSRLQKLNAGAAPKPAS